VKGGPLLFVISGPSGVGKDTVLKEMRLRSASRPRHYVVTYKSRDARPGEIDGVDYHFVGDERFAELLEQNAFLETAEVYGQWSGTPRSEVDIPFSRGEDVVLKVDVQGARSVRERIPDAVTIFLEPESLEVLQRQLKDRNTEKPKELETRLAAVPGEMEERDQFDYVVINHYGQAAATADEIERIIELAHQKQVQHEQAVRPTRT
jgi:guanylate kinase